MSWMSSHTPIELSSHVSSRLVRSNLMFTSSPLRIAYLGLTLSLRTLSFLVCIPGFILLGRQLRREERSAVHGDLANGGAELEALRKEEFVTSSADRSQQTADSSTDRETRLWQKPLAPPPTHIHTGKQSQPHTYRYTQTQIQFAGIISYKASILYLYWRLCQFNRNLIFPERTCFCFFQCKNIFQIWWFAQAIGYLACVDH